MFSLCMNNNDKDVYFLTCAADSVPAGAGPVVGPAAGGALGGRVAGPVLGAAVAVRVGETATNGRNK